jgi:hypothetical protein
MPSMNEPCPNFEGNSDFYGLGIRIGIYLQWFSSWISNSVNPSGAAANHDTNTIFLCALLIATAVAFADGSLQLAEKYVLLLLSWGFFCTVLSFLGLRLRLLRPSSLKPFRQALIPMLASPTTYPPRLSPLSGLKVNPWILFRTRLRISFQPNSKFRHWALSWAGVIVRSAIGYFLAVLSLLTWWENPATTAERADPCVTTVCFFGSRDLSGSLFAFFRVATIILTIPAAWLFLVSLQLVMRLMCHAGDWYVRYWVIRASEFVSPGAWDRLDGDKKIALGALVGFWTNPLAVLSYSSFGFLAGLIALRKRYLNEDRLGRQPRVSPPVARDAGESVRIPHSDQFWNVNAGDCPPFSQVLQALVSMLSRGVDSVETKEDAINRSGEPA